MKKALIFMAFAILTTVAQAQQEDSRLQKTSAQGLRLKNIDKKKTFHVGHQLILTLTQDREIDCANCEFNFVNGYLKRVTQDSVTMSLETLIRSVNENGENVIYSRRMRGAPDLPDDLTIPIEDIFEIQVYKSDKHHKRRSTFETLGGLIILTGVITLGNTLIVKKESKSTLALVGLAELGVGIVLASGSRMKKYRRQKGWSISSVY